MTKVSLIIAGLVLSLLGTSAVLAQSALGTKSNLRTYPQRTSGTSSTQTQDTAQANQDTVTSNSYSDAIHNLQNQVKTIETQLGKYSELSKVNHWLNWWWQIGFWMGILWILLWVFVGRQWAKLKFWGFGWPWPWWFWIPWLWFIPWLIIAWQWWLVWWPWWIWIWWIFPWVFWLFWWIILFKESTIWVWRRRKPTSTLTE